MASEAMDILGDAAFKKKDVPKKAPKVRVQLIYELKMYFSFV